MSSRTRHIITVVVALFLALGLALTAAPVSTAQQAGGSSRLDRDCSDFATQAAAQQYFLNNGGPNNDPDRLDDDGDGVACESNPCPCSSATGGGGGNGGGGTPAPPPLRVDRAIVIKVVDGDTVDVRLRRNGTTARVRLIGIDTPEIYGGVECGGPAASANAKRLLPRGTPVLLTSDRSQALKDRYGRLLRYMQKTSNQVDVAHVQLFKGHARVYVYGGKPFKKVAKYRSYERSARNADRGLWGACR